MGGGPSPSSSSGGGGKGSDPVAPAPPPKPTPEYQAPVYQAPDTLLRGPKQGEKTVNGAPTGYAAPAPRGGPTKPAPILSFQTEYTPGNVNNTAGDLYTSAEPGTDSREVVPGRRVPSTPAKKYAPATIFGRSGLEADSTPTPTPTAPTAEPEQEIKSPHATAENPSTPGGYRFGRTVAGTGGGGQVSFVEDPLGYIRNQLVNLLG